MEICEYCDTETPDDMIYEIGISPKWCCEECFDGIREDVERFHDYE